MRTIGPNGQAVVGIDVGGIRKGFHAVALREGIFDKTTSTDPGEIVAWCIERNADVVAVDAPCRWRRSPSLRLAERELTERRIHCFFTPTAMIARNHPTDFYNWMLRGEALYDLLERHYSLFDGRLRNGPICFETFPHAIVCALAGRVVPAKPKKPQRREVLRRRGLDDSVLASIDFIDAALCAVTAAEFRKGRIMKFGEREEGFIVVPMPDAR